MSVRLFVVEDHKMMRKALTDFLEGHANLTIDGMAESAEEALEQLDESAVDLVLADAQLPGMDGIEFVRVARERHPGLLCIMLSGHDHQLYVDQALEAGARGYLAKGKPSEIPKAISRVLDGETYCSTSSHHKEGASKV
jgi:DNA-binding NarL/FixJ family response regulator